MGEKLHSPTEAMEEYNNNKIISGWGYTFFRRAVDGKIYHYYMAYGTFPGCIRATTPLTIDFLRGLYIKGARFETITIQEYIMLHGFYPDPYMFGHCIDVAASTQEMIDFRAMMDCCCSGACSIDKLKDPIESSRFWTQWFNERSKIQ